MEEDNKIIYILIGTESLPLAGYGKYKGEFISICERRLKTVEPGKSASVTTTDYKIFYHNVEGITYMMMTIPTYPMAAGVACLDSMYKEFGTSLHGRNFQGMKDYGLNSELQEKLKMKFDYYDKNTEIVDEKLQDLKKVMMNFKDEVIKAADALNERGEMLSEMQIKAKDLEADGYSFKKGAIQVRKTECKKKACYISIIVAIILVVILVIVLIVNRG